MTRLLHIILLFCSAFAAASACEDGTKDVVEGTRCRKYAECQNGSWQLKDCQFGQIFDHNTLSCVPVTEMKRCYDVSRCAEGRVYSHMGKSNLYYQCVKGHISVHLCGEGEIFDPEAQQCRLEHDVILVRSNKKIEVGACTEGSKHRDGKSCKDYLECVNGAEVKKTCSQCMNFDDNTQTCQFVFITPCGDTPTPTPPTTTTTPKPTTPTPKPTMPTEPTKPTTKPTTPTEPTTPSSEPTSPGSDTTPIPTSTVGPCKNGEKEGVVDPNCKAYEECKNGEWVQDACGWFRKFDAVKKDCYFIWWNTITCAK